MKTTFALAFAVALCALLFGGCATSTAEYNKEPISVSIPANTPQDKILRAMAQTFVNRHWKITGHTDDSVSANIQHKSYDTDVTMKIKGQSIVFYANLERARYQEGRKSKDTSVPVGWLQNLQKDLNKNLQMAQF